MAVAAFPFWEQADSKGRRLYEERILSEKNVSSVFEIATARRVPG